MLAETGKRRLDGGVRARSGRRGRMGDELVGEVVSVAVSEQ